MDIIWLHEPLGTDKPAVWVQFYKNALGIFLGDFSEISLALGTPLNRCL